MCTKQIKHKTISILCSNVLTTFFKTLSNQTTDKIQDKLMDNRV